MAAETRGKTSVPPTPESARQSFNRVLFELSNAKNTALVHSIPRENTELLITSLEADKRVGEGPWRFSYNSLTQSFYAKKPCELHTSVVKWSRAEIISMLFTEFLNSDEVSSIEILVGSTISGMRGPYAYSKKQPDAAYRPRGISCPSIVFEVGFVESLEDLRQDMHLWLDGTNFKVSTVVLVKFFLRGNRTRVAGTVEVYRPNSEMTEAVLCSANDLWEDPHVPGRTIEITRSELYGVALPLGRNGTDTYRMQLDELESWATRAAFAMGMTTEKR